MLPMMSFKISLSITPSDAIRTLSVPPATANSSKFNKPVALIPEPYAIEKVLIPSTFKAVAAVIARECIPQIPSPITIT